MLVGWACWLFAGRADAAPVTDPNAAPPGAVVLHFDEVAVPVLTEVTDQFESFGVTFPAPPAWAMNDNSFSGYPGIFGLSIDNFSITGICEPTYSIQFAAPVAFAGFDIVTNDGDNTDVVATLDGAFVESNQFVTTVSSGGFIGFDNPGGFDRLDISVQFNVNGCMVVDELTFSGSNCGDGMIDGAEACDEGGETATCDIDCTLPVCGDGRLNVTAGEACDDDGESAECDPDCTLATCGDGQLNMTAGELCDDAGESAACNVDCTIPMCGDDVVNMNAGEECDDSTESPTCDPDCTLPVCGDGYENNTALEVCDDGNTADCDGCRGDCSDEEDGCGDGYLCPPEECDDGNVDGGDGCSSTCTVETMGESSSSEGSSSEGGSEGESSGEGASSSEGGVDESGSTTTSSDDSTSATDPATATVATTIAESGDESTSTDGIPQSGGDSGCGCASDRPMSTAWAGLAALALVRRRRRR